ncbi:hypothetical protein K8Q95_27310 [Escherichia coli]
MTTILSDYNKSILIELLNTNRQIIVVHGDDIDDYYTDSCYDIIFIDYYDDDDFTYNGQEIWRGDSIYLVKSYQDEIQNRIEKGQELIFVNKENDISFSESILTYYHLFDYAGKTFEIDGQIIDEQTKVFAAPERRCACRTCWKVPARRPEPLPRGSGARPAYGNWRDFFLNKKGSVTSVSGDANLDQIADVSYLLDTFFAKVTRTALQNAASIAGLMITTEAMVAEAPKKDEPAMPPGGGMGGMGGMDF